MLMMVSTTFIGCVDDNDDTEAPYLEVSPTTLEFTTSGVAAEGSQSYFEITTNRAWTATVTDNKSWVTLSAIQGDGNTRVNVSIPAGINDEATIEIIISNKVGPLKKEYVTIKSGEVADAVVIYHTNVGDEALSSNPYVDAYTGWNATGTGASTVTYSGEKATVRASGNSNNGAYNGASGPNIIFFGSLPSYFDINKISMTSEQTNLQLTFGASYSYRNDDGVYDNTFDVSKFEVSLSADGTSWVPLTYTINDGDQASPYWVFATANFTLAQATSELYIRYTATVASVFRLDDITLQTGNGGETISLEGGVTPPEPGDGEASSITIPELISTMTSTSTNVDASADRYLEAIVLNDTVAMNYSNNQLIVSTEGATTGNNGITLYGSQVDPRTIKVNKGDKIKVTLKKGLANKVVYNGLYEVTGAASDAWVSVEKISTASVTTTPLVIQASELSSYQSMVVTIDNATPSQAGVWGSSTTHNFTAGSDFAVFCSTGATFANVNYYVATGSITGISTVYRNVSQLVPRSLDDVTAFLTAGTEPTITAVTPSSLSFTAEGGTKTVEVTVSNQGSNTLSVSGLSGILSATISGTTVTVVATENTGDAENQTLTITLENGNSVTVPVTVAQQGGSTSDTYTLISKISDLAAGKYFMSGYAEKTNSGSELAPYSYQMWTGAISGSTASDNNSDLKTVSYEFSSGVLTPKTASDAVSTEMELVAVSGKANTYYIVVDGKYLYSFMTKNRRLYFTDDTAIAEWVISDRENGNGLLLINNGVQIRTGAADSNFLRSYVSESSAAQGVYFFKKND